MKPTIRNTIHANNNHCQIDLCGSDYIVTNMGVPMILFFNQRVEIEPFEQALKKVVSDWYILAGRIRCGAGQKAYVDCNDAGMLFEVYQHKKKMPKPNRDQPLRKGLRKFHPLILPWQVENKDQPLAVIQLHQFTDGTIFSLTCCHSVADGWGMWAFIDAISKTIRGESYDKPNHDRTDVSQVAERYWEHHQTPPHSPRLADTNRLQKALFTLKVAKEAAFPKPNEILELPKEVIKSLQRKNPDIKLSRQDIAIGFITLGMELDHVGALANMRLDKSIALPTNFSGNALSYKDFPMGELEPALTQESTEKQVLYFAKKWRETSQQDAGEDIIEYLAHLEHRRSAGLLKKVVALNLFDIFADGILINNYSVFPIYEVDFGGGTAEWYEMLPFPFRGALITNTPEMDGGLLLNLTADQQQLDTVRKIIDEISAQNDLSYTSTAPASDYLSANTTN